MIKLTNVNKYFNKKKSNELHVINNTSIELEDKGLVTFLGNSGCGKTTLLNVIGGLDKVDSGEIYIDDECLTKKRDSRKDEIRNGYIGYIFQNYNLIEDRTVFFNVEIVLRMMGIKDKEEIEKRVLFILGKVGIERYKNRPVKALSGGERQRVGIARALVKNPKIIIADEPTGNLDSRNTIEIMNIIKAISREKLVILVTHERDLADFYASRIIEIVDGRIVSDKENANEKDLDYHMENRIFLKDMPVHSHVDSDNLNIDYYSDNPEKNIDIRVVVKNNNIYISLPEGYRTGSETTELVDSHYEKISKDVYEDYTFDYDPDETGIKGTDGKIKYTSVFSFRKILADGYRKVAEYSVIRKILLLGFVFAAVLTMYSVSTISAAGDIKDEDFMTAHKNYLSVETGKLTPEIFKRYSEMEGIDYVLPGDGKMNIVLPTDDFYQSAGSVAESEASIADKDMLTEENIVEGGIPHKENQIVLDRMVVKRILDDGQIKQIGVSSEKDFIGRIVRGGDAGDLIISGISDTGSPAVYMNRSEFFKVMTGIQSSSSEQNSDIPVKDYKEELKNGNISLKTGSLPEDDYQVMIPYEMYGTLYTGSVSDIKVNGKSLKVSGFYEDRIPGRNYSYVNEKTMKYAVLEGSDGLTVSPADKEKTFAQLQESNIKVRDNYADDREEHVKELKDRMLSAIIVSLVILIISLIEIYLILRASFLSRIKEVGVLRAIGLKKKDVYKMFLGEIIAMTTLTGIPSLIITGYILNSLETVPYVGEFIKMDPSVFAVSFMIIFAANIVFGLLPVFGTMRKTPAAILARNDIN